MPLCVPMGVEYLCWGRGRVKPPPQPQSPAASAYATDGGYNAQKTVLNSQFRGVEGGRVKTGKGE